METKIIKNLEELKFFVEDFFSEIPKEREGALVIALEGNLGSGKTTFTQEVAKYFEVKEIVTSPTFVIQKKYKINNDKDLNLNNLIHIDAYRLDKDEEILMLDWQENLSDPKNLILIEWPEKIKKHLPAATKKINFEFLEETKRKLSF